MENIRETTIKNPTPNTVLGKVRDTNGRTLTNLKVAIYDVDMRECQALFYSFNAS
jgi:hypothetical protein